MSPAITTVPGGQQITTWLNGSEPGIVCRLEPYSFAGSPAVRRWLVVAWPPLLCSRPRPLPPTDSLAEWNWSSSIDRPGPFHSIASPFAADSNVGGGHSDSDGSFRLGRLPVEEPIGSMRSSSEKLDDGEYRLKSV